MNRALVLVLLLATAGAQAQDGAGRPDDAGMRNDAFVDLRPAGIQLLARARRASAGGDPATVAATYLLVAAELTQVEPSWVVPDRDAPRVGYLGVQEALRRQISSEPVDVWKAWAAVAEPRAQVLLSAAGLDRARLLEVAARFPVCPAAVEALRRVGDGHLEVGARARALGAYRAAVSHVGPGQVVPGRVARRLALALSTRPTAPDPTLVGERQVGPAVTTWLTLSSAAPAQHWPAVTTDTVAIAGRSWVQLLRRRADGSLDERWHWESPAAAEQARVAHAQETAARNWARRWPGRWRGSVPLPAEGSADHVPAPVVTGTRVVALLGRGARAPMALAPVYGQLQGAWAMRRRWANSAGRRMQDEWDGESPPARHLVALDRRTDSPTPLWRLGGEAGIGPLGAHADFASAPMACGDEIWIGALATGSRQVSIAAHVLRIDAATGAVRAAPYLATGQLEAMRGRAGSMLRVPPGMGLGMVDGRVIVVTNLGVVAACNPDTGTVLWARRYPQQERPTESTRPQGLARPLDMGRHVVVAPWDGEHVLMFDVATGTERYRWRTSAERPLRLVATQLDGAPVALEHGGGNAPDRLVVLRPGLEQPEPLAVAPEGQRWNACAVEGGVAWLAGNDAIDRVDLATGAVSRAHWFGRDRPERVACVAGIDGLAVATDRHLHWLPWQRR